MQGATSEQKTALKHLLTEEKNESKKVEKVLQLFNQLEVPSLTKKAMEHYFELGMNALRQISVNEEVKRPLVDLAEMLMNRKE